jgi:hypothetical protein
LTCAFHQTAGQRAPKHDRWALVVAARRLVVGDSRRGGGGVIDLSEGLRRAQEGLCQWCAQPLPEEAAHHRQFCNDKCRQANHRAHKKAGLR